MYVAFICLSPYSRPCHMFSFMAMIDTHFATLARVTSNLTEVFHIRYVLGGRQAGRQAHPYYVFTTAYTYHLETNHALQL